MEKHITGIVLAGGKSSRMGADKGMVNLNGKKFIDHILSALVPNVNDVIIIANNGNYNNLGYKVYEDIVKDCGPLGGIYTGLTNSTTEINMVVSCDIPFINAGLVKYILHHSKGAEITVPVNKGNIEPLCAVYTKKMNDEIFELIKHHELKMHHMLRHFITKEVHITPKLEFYNDKLLLNINTPEELKKEKEVVL